MRVVDLLSGFKYDQFVVESWVKGFWARNRVYDLVKAKSSTLHRKFYFLDGPPYASAKSIHVGTAWNKVIKDIVLRYYRMSGYNVWDKPGYDTHGLPIEVKIEQSLGLQVKKDIYEKVGVESFIMQCKAFVDENMKAMSEQFKELGVFMDWGDAYVTYKNDYIEAGWWLIKKAHEKGLLYRGYRVLHWCPRCETTLADYEVSEYRELEDPSIYVKFPVRGRPGEYLLIWTTTPWTLPANVFIMAHPDFNYVKVKVKGETLIMAKARLKAVMEEAGVGDYEVVGELKGVDLEGLEYDHPLEDLVDAQKNLIGYHKVVLASEGVVEYEGTGLVHSAPGHGVIDYDVGLRLGFPVVSLVDDSGRMSEDAGAYKGLYFRTEANKAIMEDLERKGVLFHKSTVVHRYPVCWRCKTPLALRATNQWFIGVTKLKDELIREAENIDWRPEWAKTRFMNMLQELRDWVISRQRFWGIPLPIWTCRVCGYTHVVGSVKELEEMGGYRPGDLHRPWIDKVTLKCPKCGGVMERVPDVLDVWFDSGVSFYASLGYPMRRDLYESLEPADFIVEGHDQIRGWFFSLLRSGVIGFGKTPYRRVLVHGFALDEQGREMHKSLGNYVEFEELISRVPRDVFRFWVSSNTTWEDLKFSWKALDYTFRDFTVIWNTFVFASTYMGLDGFDPEVVTLESVRGYLEVEDKWMLSRVNNLVKKYSEAMGDLRVHDASRALRSFILDDVSRFYVRLVRRRVWEEADTPSKRAAYVTLYYVLKTWLSLAAPIIPFTTEYLYQHLFKPAEKNAPESVHLLDMPSADESFIDERLERDMDIARSVIDAALAARAAAGLKLRRPVRRVIVAAKDPEVLEAFSRLSEVIGEMVNAKSVEVKGLEFLEELRVYTVKPRMGEVGRDFKKLTPLIVELMESKAGEIARSITSKGYYEAQVEGATVRLEPRHVEIEVEYPSWLSARESELATVAVDTQISPEEEAEGYAKEVVRRVQHMRKEAKLMIDDRIEVWITGDEGIVKAVEAFEDYVKGETRAVKINYEEPPSTVYSKEWDIEDKVITIGLRKV
ncbi:MAG: isoleucine--tRNA ligase [Thermoprotei archaeon]|nr:isoleucine--tRNA ligase [Thermoprotei archaeon]